MANCEYDGRKGDRMSKKYHNHSSGKWQHFIELIVVLATIVGTNIPLHLHMDTKMDEFRTKNHDILEGIRQDMKDFHGRLCAIEERNKK
jgi:hypothetical protein